MTDAQSLHCATPDQFTAASRHLLGDLARWAMAAGLDTALADEIAHQVELALDWKFSYADRHLGRWTTADIDEFLLHWCPAKLSATAQDAMLVPLAVVSLCQYLGDAGLLAPGSTDPDELVNRLPRLVSRFTAAMDDSANFGVGKSLMSAAVAAGIDLSDTEALSRWMDEFNALPFDERAGIIPDSAFGAGAPEPAPLPPVVLPDDATLAASRAATPVLGMMAALTQFVGPAGRKLTAKGNLTLADARELVPLLGTGDVIDVRIGERTFKTKSSAELRTLHQIFTWSRKAVMVRVANGKVLATKRGLALAKDPAGGYDRVVDALLDLGPLASQRIDGAWTTWPDVEDLLDGYALHLLTGPYVRGRLGVVELIAVATRLVLEAFEFPNLDDDEVEDRVGHLVTDMFETFELAGLIRRVDLPSPDVESLERLHPADSVEITAAGLATVNRLLREAGQEAPVAGSLAAAPALDLLSASDHMTFDEFRAEADAWILRRAPQEAVADLAGAARELTGREPVDMALVNLALALMGDVSVELARGPVEDLARLPTITGFARCWLVDHGLADPSAVFDAQDVSWFPDALAYRLLTGGPEALLSTLDLAGPGDGRQALLDRLWRSPSPATETVLTALGKLHPDKAVAKAARKAALRHRTWRATEEGVSSRRRR